MRKLNIRAVSQHERIKHGIRDRAYVTAENKDAQKSVSVWSWTHFYHKPYANDWNEAYNKACERKRRYKE